MKSKRTKCFSIIKSVKDKVYARDSGRCIFCGRAGLPEAHFIPRSQSGLGIEENVFTACRECHSRLDQSIERKAMLEVARAYLDVFYPSFSDEDRRYKK